MIQAFDMADLAHFLNNTMAPGPEIFWSFL